MTEVIQFVLRVNYSKNGLAGTYEFDRSSFRLNKNLSKRTWSIINSARMEKEAYMRLSIMIKFLGKEND